MKKTQKAVCALAELCLSGMAPASVAKVNASEQAAYNFEEIMHPVWESDTSYMETVLPVKNAFGGIDPIQLLYPIKEIVEVKNSALTVTYQEGVDYTVSGGRLIISDEGNIPAMSYEEFHPQTGQSGFEAKDGGYVCFHEGDFFHSRQIVVTYTHTGNYAGYIPKSKRDLLPKVTEKLHTAETFDLLVFGDSISVGANSSGFVDSAPYMPIYSQLFAMQLERAYGCKVNLVNPSVGGKGVSWGLNTIDEVLAAQSNVDLALVAFGMNDGSMRGVDFANKLSQLIKKIQTAFADAEIMAVATMLPNPEAKNFDLNQAFFHDAMVEQCERQGVAVVNMTDVHKSLLERKRYADMTGNNVNHPNDYLARVYAQTLFATLQQTVIDGTEQPGETQNSQTDSQADKTPLDAVISGCNGTAATVGAATALGAAAMVLKKKKEE